MLVLALGMFAEEEPGGFSTILAVAQRDLLNGLELTRSAEADKSSLQCKPSLLPNQDCPGASPPSRLERVVEPRQVAR